MKKIFSIVLIALLALTGCSAGSSGPAELSFATWAGGEELAELQKIVDQVNEENKDEFTIKIQSVPADYMLKMQTQFSAGKGPDIMWLEQNNLASLASQGVVLPIDEYVSKSEEMKKYKFNEKLVKTASYEGKQYGIPWISNPMVLYYNKDIVSADDQKRLDEAVTGKKLTLDEFKTMAAKYNKDGNNGTLFNGWPPFEYFLWNNGGEVEDETGKPLFNTPEGVKAVEYMVDTMQKNPITPDMEKINAAGYGETFKQGKTAFIMGGTADKMEMIEDEAVPFKVGYSLVPGDFTYNWSASYAMTKDTKNKDAAYKAIEALTLKTWEWKMVPPVEITDLGFKDYEEYLAKNAPHKTGMGPVIDAAMGQTHDYSYSAKSAKTYGVLWEEIYAPILNGRISGKAVEPKTLLDNAQKKIESE